MRTAIGNGRLLPRFAVAAMAAAGLVIGGLAVQRAPVARAQPPCDPNILTHCVPIQPSQPPDPNLLQGRLGGSVPNLVFTAFNPTGNPGEWTMTIQNIGTAMMNGTNVIIVDPSGHGLWSGTIPALLGMPEFQTVSFTIQAGSFPNGIMQAIIDPYGSVPEVDDSASSNVMAMPLYRQPDLAVTAHNLLPGGPTDRVGFTITNTGGRDAGKFTVQVTGDKGFSQTLYLGGLAAGASQTFSLTGRQTGETIRIVADPSNALYDYNLGNNLGVSAPAP